MLKFLPVGGPEANPESRISAMPHPVSRYNNKTSYYFDRELGTCKEIDFPVGILTPDWLANATYLGTDTVDTYDTHLWTKSDGFIKYWADVKTGLPVTLSSTPAVTLRHQAAGLHQGWAQDAYVWTVKACKDETHSTVANAPGRVPKCTRTPVACIFLKLEQYLTFLGCHRRHLEGSRRGTAIGEHI